MRELLVQREEDEEAKKLICQAPSIPIQQNEDEPTTYKEGQEAPGEG
jgi:hypothetical protein